MSFIHLRVASAFSMKYGTTQPVDLVEQAREYAMPALPMALHRLSESTYR
jgi:error-prone DNA polymerase